MNMSGCVDRFIIRENCRITASMLRVLFVNGPVEKSSDKKPNLEPSLAYSSSNKYPVRVK